MDTENTDTSSNESLKRYPCGCLKSNISSFYHWWKYTRIRLFFRYFTGWRLFIWWHLWTRCNELKCRIAAFLVPVRFELGMLSMSDAVHFESIWKENISNWIKIRRELLFLSSDPEHPDGIYAKSGFDIIPVTGDEYDHWHRNKLNG